MIGGIVLLFLIYNSAWLTKKQILGEVTGRMEHPIAETPNSFIFLGPYILFILIPGRADAFVFSVTEEGFKQFKPGDTIPITYKVKRITRSFDIVSYPNMTNKILKIY